MERVGELSHKVLIGRLEYRRLGKKEWVDWATTHWKPLINYVPTISLLAKGWLVFVFLEVEHALIILNSLWSMGKGFLVLNRWHAAFDPLRERW